MWYSFCLLDFLGILITRVPTMARIVKLGGSGLPNHFYSNFSFFCTIVVFSLTMRPWLSKSAVSLQLNNAYGVPVERVCLRGVLEVSGGRGGGGRGSIFIGDFSLR